jgi:hypothetical protein
MYSIVPDPPEGDAVLVMADGLKGAQPLWLLPILPPFVTLLHVLSEKLSSPVPADTNWSTPANNERITIDENTRNFVTAELPLEK